MRGKYNGMMPVEDFFQSVYQDIAFFKKHNITHIKSACLYFTPCDEHGNTVIVRNKAGQIVDGFMSAGAYPSAAQQYEEVELEPQCVERKTLAPRSTPPKTMI
jgi:hypothetical protein